MNRAVYIGGAAIAVAALGLWWWQSRRGGSGPSASDARSLGVLNAITPSAAPKTRVDAPVSVLSRLATAPTPIAPVAPRIPATTTTSSTPTAGTLAPVLGAPLGGTSYVVK